MNILNGNVYWTTVIQDKHRQTQATLMFTRLHVLNFEACRYSAQTLSRGTSVVRTSLVHGQVIVNLTDNKLQHTY